MKRGVGLRASPRVSVAVMIALALVLGLGASGRAAAPLPRVTMIADSVGGVFFWTTAPRDAFAKNLDLDLQVKTCRKLVSPGCPAYDDDHPPSALDTIHALGDQIGSIVVIDVGYNDLSDSYASDLDGVMQALADAHVARVIWVTLEEMQPTWITINDQIRAAQARWPELTVADWAPVSAGQPWFADGPHMNYDGAVAFAAFLRPYVLSACGGPCEPPPPQFCGLAWTVKGFMPVELDAGDSCAAALAAAVAVERGVLGEWQCSTGVAQSALDCTRGDAEFKVLSRSPVPAVRHGVFVTLANWTFARFGLSLEGRSGIGPWHTLMRRPPYCVPAAPVEALIALRLRRTTRSGNCFAPRR